MKEPPADLVTSELVDTLQVYWRLEVIQLDYLAVGFGAHHWQATTPTGARYFMALHELGHADGHVDYRTAALAQLQQALAAARWLETSAELDFVIGPVPDVWSTCCRPVARAVRTVAVSVARLCSHASARRSADGGRTGAIARRCTSAAARARPN